MTQEVVAEITPAELAQIVQSVFETMLGMNVEPAENPWFASTSR